VPEVYAQHFELEPKPGWDSIEALTGSLRSWVGTKLTEAAEFEFGELPVTREFPDGSILRWEPFEESGTRLLDFGWRHPHPPDPSISWATKLSYFEEGGRAVASLRVFNTGPETGDPRLLLTTRPRLVLQLLEFFNLWCDGARISSSPELLDLDDVPRFVPAVLANSDRRAPALLVTPDEDGCFPISLDEWGREFVTLGKLFALATPQCTYALTDLVGKRLSVFRAAARVYLPGFRNHDDPLKHPLVLGHRVGVRTERMRLAQWLSALTPRRFREPRRINELRDRRAVAYESARSRILGELAARREEARDAESYREIVDLAVEENRALDERNRALQDELQEARAKIEWLRSENSRLSRRLADSDLQPGYSGEFEVPELEASSVLVAVENAAAIHGDHVLFLPSAMDSARESIYRRPKEVSRILAVLAQVAEQMNQPGGLGRSLSDAFREQNVDYRASIGATSSKRIRKVHQFQHDGNTFECYEHLCLGGTYDPADCLRVYFTSRQQLAGRLVVGHVGRHLEVMSST